MASPISPRQSIIDLENKKFRQGTDADDIGVKTFTIPTSGHPLDSLKWDSYQITYGATTDVVEYYQGGLAGTLLITFTATYSNTSKNDLISGVWT